MVDVYGDVWLIEVNTSPDLSFSTATTAKMSAKLMTDIAVLQTRFEGWSNPRFVKLYNHAVQHGGAYIDKIENGHEPAIQTRLKKEGYIDLIDKAQEEGYGKAKNYEDAVWQKIIAGEGESAKDIVNKSIKFVHEPYRCGNLVLMTASIMEPKVGRTLGMDSQYSYYRENYNVEKEYFISFPNLKGNGLVYLYTRNTFTQAEKDKEKAASGLMYVENSSGPLQHGHNVNNSYANANYTFFRSTDLWPYMNLTMANHGKKFSENFPYDFIKQVSRGKDPADIG